MTLTNAEIIRLDIAGLDNITDASYEALLAQATEANTLRAALENLNRDALVQHAHEADGLLEKALEREQTLRASHQKDLLSVIEQREAMKGEVERLRATAEANSINNLADQVRVLKTEIATLREKSALADEIAPRLRTGHAFEDWLQRYDALEKREEKA